METPRVTITAEEALALITRGEPILHSVIIGTLSFEETDFKIPIVMEKCEVESIKAGSVQFNKVVKFTKCHFKKFDFPFCYFPGGLEIISCSIDSYIDFQCGGHNKPTTTVRISNTIFKGFVNFFDCIYEGPVIITNNKFEKGTNLLGNKNEPFVVSFDDVVKIEDNEGELNIDSEGDEEVPQPPISPINLN
jgi:hypothetical protein